MNNKIVLLEAPCAILDDYRNDCGELAICIPDSVQVTLNIKVEQLVELEKIVSNYANTIKLPIFGVDLLKLDYANFKKVNESTIYRALLQIDGVNLVNGFLYIDRTSEKGNNSYVEYGMQMIGTSQQWKDFLQKNTLKDLDFGSYTHEASGVGTLAPLFDNVIYQDGGDTIYPLIANFGRWYNEDEVHLMDVRFCVHKKAILDKMFCAAGYRLESVFMDTEFFRREMDYLLEENFGINDSIVSGLYTEVENSTNQPVINFGLLVRFDTVITDPRGYFKHFTPPSNINPDVWEVTDVITDVFVKFTGRVEIGPGGPGLTDVIFRFSVIDSIAGSAAADIDIVPNLGNGDDFDFEYIVNVSEFVRQQPGFSPRGFFAAFGATTSLALGIEKSNSTYTPTLLSGAKAYYYTENKHHFNTGDEIQISQVLRDNFSLYDLLLDYKKHYHLKFVTDEERKIVYAEPDPRKYTNYSTVNVPEIELEGFSGNPSNPFDIEDITEYVDICEFIEKDFSKRQERTDFDFKFKSSTDSYEGYDAFAAENELFENKQSTDRSKNSKEIKLNIFEPTLNDYDFDISVQTNLGIYLPFMWNGQRDENGFAPEPSSVIAPRCLHAYGNGLQVPDSIPEEFIQMKYNGSISTFIPNIGQVFPVKIRFLGGGNPVLNVFENNVFSDNYEQWQDKNIVNTFYQEGIDQEFLNPTVILKTKINNLFWWCLDVRKVFQVNTCKSGYARFNGHYKLVSLRYNTTTKEATFELKPITYCNNG